MQKLRRIELSTLALVLSAAAAGQRQTQSAPSVAAPSSTMRASAAVKRVQVLRGKDAVEIEIEGSERLVPQTQVLTGPDRLVVDFPNAAPAAQLRNQQVNRGEVKDVRIGLFHSNPPVTRLVLDLKTPQSYQIFPSGKTLIIKISGSKGNQAQNNAQDSAEGIDEFPPEPATRPGLVIANYTAAGGNIHSAAAEPRLEVTFRDGLLSIKANKASLSEVLFAVHQRTGAEVSVSAGAEQEKVVAEIGPAPAPEVLARLLNGSKFNYMILSSANDPRILDRVILSPKAEGAVTPLPPMNNDDSSDDDAAPPPPPQATEPAVGNAPPFSNSPPGSVGPPRGQGLPPRIQQPTTPPDENSTPD